MYFPLRGKLASGRARHEPVRVSLKHGAQCSGCRVPSPDSRAKMQFPLCGKLASGRARHEPVRVSLKHGACVWDDRVHPRNVLSASRKIGQRAGEARARARIVEAWSTVFGVPRALFGLTPENVLSASRKIGQRAGEARARARLATSTQRNIQGTARRPRPTRKSLPVVVASLG
ncbi:hypothetical protein PLICRDRAFT_181067 [Plicaturopsis crispa FD-325 SS-3]|uniref:Uncharacterized protein n=1 Tax=Plicaturopsis crispa FD-325 SS-3 TaxID=944288 RepID=A0A0C9SJX8_PLICR|nr:hypothetical protein PLICRDRAFT_181067 [Plicaturopsis crispa FD-325 SS-3]